MMSSKPNIILTFADDQRHSMLGCCDGSTADAVRTPNLDALAARGCRFTHAYHAGSPTPAVCAPSRAMLHTGRGPFDTPKDMVAQSHGPAYIGDPKAHMLGEYLQEAGYYTHLIGKWHYGEDSLMRSFNATSCVFYGGMSDHFNVPMILWDGETMHRNVRRNYVHSTEVFGEDTCEFIENYDKTEPFFLCVAFTAPHDPRITHKQWHDHYNPENIELPPNFYPEHPFDNGGLRNRCERLTPRPRDGEQTKFEIANYYAITEHLDHGIGRIHESLRKRGLEDNTIVIHSADHGLGVGQHGLLGKQNMYDHSIRVPLIIAGPGIPTGQVRRGLCYQHDLFSTLLETAGKNAPEESPFCSLWPMITGQRESNYELIGSYYEDQQRMVTNGHSKTIRYSVKGESFEQQFDLDADPWETLDGEGNPLHPPKPENALGDREFSQWQQKVNDPARSAFR